MPSDTQMLYNENNLMHQAAIFRKIGNEVKGSFREEKLVMLGWRRKYILSSRIVVYLVALKLHLLQQKPNPR